MSRWEMEDGESELVDVTEEHQTRGLRSTAQRACSMNGRSSHMIGLGMRSESIPCLIEEMGKRG